MSIEIREEAGGCRFSVKVTPRSSRNQVVGVENGVLKLKVQAPPVEGAANEAVLVTLAKWLDRSKSSIVILSGEQGRNKRVWVKGLTKVELLEALKKLKS